VVVRPSWVEVDLGAISHNVEALRQGVTPARVCAVVKADGYGHGDVPAAEAALAGGADMLGVALVEEASRLREAGIDAPILLLSEPPLHDATEVVRWNVEPTAYRLAFVEALAAAAIGPVPVHVKVDTGMHRVGVDPPQALEVARAVVAAPNLVLQGLWTHFAVAEEDAEFTKTQLGIFGDVLEALEAEGIDPDVVHTANSAGALTFPEARFDMVRLGISIYGLRPSPDVAPGLDLRPAMRVVSEVALMRRLPAGERPSYGRRRPLPADAFVATVPLGYADGVARRLGSKGGEVLVGGKRRPFAGTVTMDQILVDMGDDVAEVGDEVVLLGRQGDEEITADEWAAKLDTINYEIVCDFGPRLPRRYVP
jgi:alanine racemase